MPKLRNVLEREAAMGGRSPALDERLLELDVVGLRLATGAPCSTHAELFAPWPGPEQHVSRWFMLENGQAVGLIEDPDKGVSIAVAG
ncbi:MAG: hypothetical protein ACR2PO_11500 [Methyloligellaceae bacterium]